MDFEKEAPDMEKPLRNAWIRGAKASRTRLLELLEKTEQVDISKMPKFPKEIKEKVSTDELLSIAYGNGWTARGEKLKALREKKGDKK